MASRRTLDDFPGGKWEHPTLTHTRKLAQAPIKGTPQPQAKPAPSTLPGRPTPPLPGQLDLEGREAQ